MSNQGATQDKKKHDSNANSVNTGNNNAMEVQSYHSSKTIDLFTPPVDMRMRGFNLTSQKKPMVFIPQNLPANEFGEVLSQSSENIQAAQYLWGTNICMNDIKMKIRLFFINYRDESDGDREDNYYIYRLREIKDSERYTLNVDGNHVHKFDKGLYLQLVNYPSEMIPLMDVAASHVYQELFSNNYEDSNNTFQVSIMVRIVNLVQKSRIRDLSPNDIDKLICITGIVIRNSDVVPEMREAFFKCAVCGNTESSLLNRNKIIEPNECENCRSRFSFELVHNRSIYSDKQHVKLQETPEHMPEGETPLTIHLCCYDELVDSVKPGDRCEIIGIFRAQGLRVNPRKRVTKSIFRIYIDVIYFNKTNNKRLVTGEEDADGEVNQELQEYYDKEVANLARNPEIYNLLVDSFAPSIWENEDVKKGLLLQLFGGVSKDMKELGRGRFRGDINVLLVGDPSTAKSQLLQFVHNLAPRGIYTSGKGSSVVGLTACVTKDPETREIILESGALVLSDRGICCIDEFDKMDENTRVILHEAMEQQTISIAKAGIICQLNARSSILSSANPIHSKYDPKLSVVDNIKLPPTLLSRFDLIYLMLDRHNETSDRRLANHIVSLYGRFEDDLKEVQKNYIPRELFTAYISRAKKRNPVIKEDLVNYLTELYLEMRSMGSNRKTISATPRQLESLIRLSEARARLRFSNFVEKEDVDEAIRLIKVATQQAATNPDTGVIDMDLITTGMSTSSRMKLTQLTDTIKNILRDYSDVARKGVKLSSITDELKKRLESMGSQAITFSEFELRDALRVLEDEGIISQLGNPKSRTIRLIGFQFQ